MLMSDNLPPFSNPEQAQKDIRALGACGELLSNGYFCIQTGKHDHIIHYEGCRALENYPCTCGSTTEE
jgi:hypothetical protein